jgi:SAM-dependent methyltransferase
MSRVSPYRAPEPQPVNDSVDPDRIVALAYGFRASKTLQSAVELDVFSALADGPLALDELARRTEIHPRGARDFFDALVALGLLQRGADSRYSNAAEADLYLVRGRPSYLGDMVRYVGIREYEFYGRLTAALRTGAPQSGTRASGNYPAFYADPVALELFANGMTGGTLLPARALAGAFPWRAHRRLVDIGTAQGCLPVEIARAHAHMRAVGVDLPPLEPLFERYVGGHGLADRVVFQAGDFFVDPLPDGDVYVLGRILHNWDLATKIRLLRKVYDALAPGGAAIVCEKLFDGERRERPAGLLNSLYMLVMTSGGFDFSDADCAGWMTEVGFRDIKVAPLGADQWMVAGFK